MRRQPQPAHQSRNEKLCVPPLQGQACSQFLMPSPQNVVTDPDRIATASWSELRVCASDKSAAEQHIRADSEHFEDRPLSAMPSGPRESAPIGSGPKRYSKVRSLRAMFSKDQPTLTLQDLTARRNRFRQEVLGAIGDTVDVGNMLVWARSARPLVMKVESRPASLGVRCDVATQVSPRHRLITTYPASLCHVALRAERSPSAMNSRR